MQHSMRFWNPTSGLLSFKEVVCEITEYMKEEGEYKIIVGCDSSSSREPEFPVVIVALRKGRGGRFFLHKKRYLTRRFNSMKERIMEEVFLSCKIALELREQLEFSDVFYIHADVGENGKTKELVREVVSFIRGNGFEPKIKPESFVASSLADKYTQ